MSHNQIIQILHLRSNSYEVSWTFKITISRWKMTKYSIIATKKCLIFSTFTSLISTQFSNYFSQNLNLSQNFIYAISSHAIKILTIVLSAAHPLVNTNNPQNLAWVPWFWQAIPLSASKQKYKRCCIVNSYVVISMCIIISTAVEHIWFSFSF